MTVGILTQKSLNSRLSEPHGLGNDLPLGYTVQLADDIDMVMAREITAFVNAMSNVLGFNAVVAYLRGDYKKSDSQRLADDWQNIAKDFDAAAEKFLEKHEQLKADR